MESGVLKQVLHPYYKAVISLKQDAVTLCGMSSRRGANRDATNMDFARDLQPQPFSRILRVRAWVATFPTLGSALNEKTPRANAAP
jgi:hypothetical protein